MHIAAGLLLAEGRRAGAAHDEAAVEVNVDNVGPVGPAHAMKNAIAQDAGIVDQNVDAAEGIERRLHDLVAIGRLADRQRRGDRFAAGLFYFLDYRLRRPRVSAGTFKACADVANHNAGTLLRHQYRDGAADAAPGSGHDSDFAFHNARHQLPPDLLGDFDDHFQLRPLFFLGKGIAFLGR